MKHRVFVASALESKPVAEAVQRNLSADRFARVTVWDRIFRPGQFTLEALVEEAENVDFGVFIFTGDDLARIRKQEFVVTRDNVLFELGLFTGHLGRRRCILLLPDHSKEEYHMPADLAGLTTIRYSVPEQDESLVDATRAACAEIKEAILSQAWRLPPMAEITIKGLLQSTANLIGGNEVRGFCHLFDGTSLRPAVYYLGTRYHKDPHVIIPADHDWYIVARAFKTAGYVCGEVDQNIEKSTVPGARDIRDDIKSVAAAPIPSDGTDPIGTVAFDSNRGMDEIGWRGNTSVRDAIQFLGDALATIVRRIH
jgi:hypothetical protein